MSYPRLGTLRFNFIMTWSHVRNLNDLKNNVAQHFCRTEEEKKEEIILL